MRRRSTPTEIPAGGPPPETPAARRYWDQLAETYQRETVISCADFHYGPLIPGDRYLHLLPPDVRGLHCLEAGSGAGQNSIHLARQGAYCTATDLSAGQLRAGLALARRHRARVHFVQADMAVLPFAAEPGFDLVHSAYALPFAPDPGACIQAMARLLSPGGALLLSTAHPLAAGEWLELDGVPGVFLPDYLRPPADRRRRHGGEAVCQPAPLSAVFGWLTAAGLCVEDLREPQALPLDGLTPAQLRARVPYWSPGWLALADRFQRVPVVAIFRARRPVAAGRRRATRAR